LISVKAHCLLSGAVAPNFQPEPHWESLQCSSFDLWESPLSACSQSHPIFNLNPTGRAYSALQDHLATYSHFSHAQCTSDAWISRFSERELR